MNPELLSEYRRNIDLGSREAAALLDALEMQAEVVLPTADALEALRLHFAPQHAADWYHAATCFETGAILISNDRDFDALQRSGAVQVLTVSQALRQLKAV